VLDIGSASGDAARTIGARWPRACVISLDRRLSHLRCAPRPRVAADAFRLPFPPRSFDIVHCALFLHHFPNPQVVELIANMLRLARRSVILIDLQRHAIPYLVMPASRWLFGWQDLTVSDGQISIQAAFHPQELRALAKAAGAREVALRCHWPWFRISAVLRV
jgi:ubiquinone/menaquinone biosynthesis C-methylase UbiE